MNTAVTDIGIRFPKNITDAEFLAAGRTLAKIERGMQWAIGDWYNAIRFNDKEKTCREVGLKPNAARSCGWVAGEYEIDARASNVSFTHHRLLARDELTPARRVKLLALAGKHKWTARELKTKRDEFLGIKAKPAAESSFRKIVDGFVDNMPKGVAKSVKAQASRLFEKQLKDFDDTVRSRVSAEVKVERTRLNELREKREEEAERAKKIRQGVNAHMTHEEYRLILGCLHPDKTPSDERKAKAFAIFSRLKDTVHHDAAKRW